MPAQAPLLSPEITRIWEKVFARSDELVFAIDAQRRIVAVSEGFVRRFGGRGEDVVGHQCVEVAHADGRIPGHCPFHELLLDGGQHEAEVRSDRLGGEFLVRVTPIVSDDGELECAVHTLLDVTDRRRTAEALAESEARFHGYFEQSLVGVAVTSPQRGWIEANQAVCDLLGYSREELASLTWAELTHPEDLDADVAEFERALAGEIDGYRLEKRFLRKDGSVVDVDLSVHCERAADGSVEYFLALLSDITQRRRAEWALQDSESRLRASLDSMLDPHVVLGAVRDESGGIVDFVFAEANAAACAFNRLRHDELVGLPLLEQHPAAGTTDLFARYVHVVESGEPLILDDWAYPQDLLGGELRHYDVRAVRLGDGLSQTWRDVTERHRETELLAASEERLRLATEAAQIGISTWELAGGGLTWDERLCAWYEVPAEVRRAGLYYGFWRSRVHPDDLQRTERLLFEARDGGSAYDDVFRIVRSDGEVRHIHSTSVTERGEHGAAVRMIGVSLDITDSVRREEELRLLAENASDVVFRGSNEGVALWFSSSVTALVGWRPEDLVGRSFAEFVHPEDLPRLRAGQSDVAHGTPASYEVRVRTAAGDYRWVAITLRPVLDEAGAVVGRVGGWRDVQAEREARRALEESEARLRAVADTAADAIVTADLHGTIRFWNHGAERMFGYAEAEAIGRPVTMIMPEHYAAAHPASLARFREGAERRLIGRVVELEARRRDGSELPIELSLAEWEVAGEHFVTTIIRDVSERREAGAEIRRLNDELEERVLQRTAQLEASNRELEAFVYSASHDLRTPLRAIDGFSQAVIEDAADRLDATDREHLQRVRSAAQRMALLIDHLLALSRAGRQDLHLETVDVTAMASSIVEQLRREHPERQVELVVERGLTAQADDTLLRVILGNLLENAWKFTSRHETARIEVGALEAGGERAFFVRDDGAGFSMDGAQHLFGAFQRFHSADEFEGDGIGLATVQRLVARHGGRVWAEADVEKGAAFYFTLPRPGLPA